MRGYENHHGFGSKLYWSYRDMLKRCYNPSHKNFHQYGGRGIVVCDRWLKSFENFRCDVGERPEGKTLDRKDNNGPYSPENCRWASYVDQQNNKRNNHKLIYKGEEHTIASLSRELAINSHKLSDRLRAGWDLARAIA